MKNTKKKHNSNNITSWVATFIFLASAIAIIFNYIDLKNPTITQVTAVFIVEILIAVVFMLIMWLDSIQLD